MKEELSATIESAITEGESHLEKLHSSEDYLQDSMARQLLPSLYSLLPQDVG